MSRYDLVVIGGGPAGEKAAAAAAYFGKKVALVERAAEGPGGAAVHTGTLPSKTLRETALYLTGYRRRELYLGISEPRTPREAHSVASFMCRLPQVRSAQSAQIEQNLARHSVELVRGSGAFEARHKFRVGDRLLESDYFLIATGSSPYRPSTFDFDDPEVHDSDSLLELDEIPERLAIIGGGVIGSEYACVFGALGVSIELIEMRSQLMSFLDTDVAAAILHAMRASGITVHLDTQVERLERVGPDLVLSFRDGVVRRFDKVLVSAGRTGNSEGLGLATLGVKIDTRKQILVDEHFRTNVSHVFAAGDVIGRPALASTSMEQGRMAVANMFGLDVPRRDWSVVPYGIYTIPEAAAVGPSEAELRESGTPYAVGRAFMKHNARGQIIGDTDGFVKLIFHRETRRLLAVHLVCERATELIHLGQAVMRLGGGINYFLESVMTYPSLTEAFKYAAYDALGALVRGEDRPPPLD